MIHLILGFPPCHFFPFFTDSSFCKAVSFGSCSQGTCSPGQIPTMLQVATVVTTVWKYMHFPLGWQLQIYTTVILNDSLFKGKEAPIRKKENKTHTEQPFQLVNKNNILQ